MGDIVVISTNADNNDLLGKQVLFEIDGIVLQTDLKTNEVTHDYVYSGTVQRFYDKRYSYTYAVFA